MQHTDNKAPDTSYDLDKIKTIQRYIRSKTRTHIHAAYFKEEPPRKASLVNFPPEYQATLGIRLHKIIDELSEAQAVINSKKLNHFTVIRNLQSIIRTNYIMGNQTLLRNNINFTGNALTAADKTDQDSLCFAPARVDSLAFIADHSTLHSANRVFKKHLCSIVCDLSALHYPGNNQFFKLTDFANSVSFYQDFIINNRLSINIYRQVGTFSRNLTLSIILDDYRYSYELNKAELFFYGHAEDINRFCLTKLFDCLKSDQSYNAASFRMKFLNYINTLTDYEIKKMLVIIGQALTYYSEFNLHSYCNMDDIRINEIRLYDQKIKYQIKQLDQKSYQDFLMHYANSEWDAPLLKQCELPLDEAEQLKPSRDLSYADNRTEKFSCHPANLFSRSTYIETRKDVNNTEDSINKLCFNQ